MFLAIAVDNLATAQELTAEQEEAEALAREQKEKSAAKEATMFLPNPMISPVQVSITDSSGTGTTTAVVAATGATNKQSVGAAAAANNKKVGGSVVPPVTTSTATTLQPIAPPPTFALTKPGMNKSKANLNNNMDVDKMITRKVDLDYIPGLDDDLKVILPGTTLIFINEIRDVKTRHLKRYLGLLSYKNIYLNCF